MAEKVITFKVKVLDESGKIVEKTVNNIQDLEKSVSDLEKEVKGSELGSKAFKEMNKELKKSKAALDEAKSSTMSLSEKLAAIPGPVGAAVQGFQGLGTAFKAIMASPMALFITAIVTALTALYKAFTSTKEGGEKVQQLMAGLGAAMDVFRDLLVKVAGKLIDFFKDPMKAGREFVNFLKDQIVNRFVGLLELMPALGKAISLVFKGEFKEAGKVATDALGKVVLGVEDITDKAAEAFEVVKNAASEALKEGKQAAQLTKTLQAIADAQRELNNRRAQQNQLIAEAKLRINDETLSYEERLAALEEVRQAEVSLAEAEAALAKRRYEAIKAQNALSDSSVEALDAESAAFQAMINAQTASQQKQKELYDQGVALRARQKADAKALADFERQLRAGTIEGEREIKLAALEDSKEADLQAIELLKTTEEEKARLRLLAEEKYQTEYKALRTEFAAEDREIEMARVQALIDIETLRYEEGKALTNQQLQDAIDLQKEMVDLMLQDEKLTAEERKKIQQEYSNWELDLLKSNAEIKEKTLEEQLQASADVLGSLAEIAGKESAFGKAAAIAQASINTYLSANEAYKSLVGIPVVGPALAPIAAAAAVVAGLKSIQQITSVQLPSPPKMAYGGLVGGYGLGTEDNQLIQASAGEAVMTKKAVDLFGPTLSAMNQLAGGKSFNGGLVSSGADQTQVELLNAMKNNGRRPVQAYVVSSQMENEAQFDRAVKSRSLI